MSVDKRTVATDALDTLGMVIDESAGRDAIHLAVEPTRAAIKLYPGQDVGIDGTTRNPVGIVDPFLTHPVEAGSMFWLVVYPRKITSLRHVWTHPAFDEAPEEQSAQAASEKWLRAYADEIGETFDHVMKAAKSWVEDEEYYKGSPTTDNGWTYYPKFEGERTHPDFWGHYETYTGETVEKKENFFTCSC